MKRRICIVGAALSAAALPLGAVAASQAAASSVTNVKCKVTVGISVAQNATAVTPPVTSGKEYGPAACGGPFGRGVQSVTFKVPDNGNRLGVFQTFFSTGSIRGKYMLVPQPGQFSPESFNETDWKGVMTITGGTGAFNNAKGTAKMICKTIDGIHSTCTNRLALSQL